MADQQKSHMGNNTHTVCKGVQTENKVDCFASGPNLGNQVRSEIVYTRDDIIRI